jgi:hypothetical protein
VSSVRIAVVRTVGKPDRFHVAREGTAEVRWTFPTYGDALPHDLVHFVVETAAGLRGGFWGRVARGADPARVNAAANRKAGKAAEKYAGFGDDLGELFVAEALAATDWSSAAWREALAASCERVGCVVPPLHEEDATAIAHVLDMLGARWRGLVPKGAIHLELDPEEPRRSFDRLHDQLR